MPKRLRSGFVAFVCSLAIAAALYGCGSGSAAPPNPVLPTTSAEAMTIADVQSIVTAAAASVDAPLAIAVTDRRGDILAVYSKPGAPAMSIGNFSQSIQTPELAVGLARTAAFFSNDQAPLSSRTVRYISGAHFPPGIAFTPNAALYGIENTNRGCSLNAPFLPGQQLNPARSIDGMAIGTGVVTGKKDVYDSDPNAVLPGGVPIFKNGHLVGGIGVAGASAEVTEFAAVAGTIANGFAPQVAAPGVVVIDGVALPFVNQMTRPAGANAGIANGSYSVGPKASIGPPPEGDLMARRAGPLGGLSLADVGQIVDSAVANANQTRAVIRLPLESRARFAIAVADLDGSLLALYRMPDSTVFSVDVAVAKARNLVYFSSANVPASELAGVPPGTAVTNRTISFGAQPFFPPGIDGSAPGPFFGLYQYDVANPCTNGHQAANGNQNGIVFFPGSVPLYRNGVLIGALGVSGDGVEQDDYVSAQASAGFEAPTDKRADQIEINGVRLPYLKFPRNPTL